MEEDLMSEKIEDGFVYLDTYTLQQDMRLRLPKTIIENMGVIKGKTAFDIYMKNDKSILIIKVSKRKKGR